MRTCSKTECNHNVMMSSRNAPRVLPIPPRGELCAIRFRFWPAGTTHLSTGRPHGIRPSPRRPREAYSYSGSNVSAAIRTCHTGSPFLERMSPSRQEDPRIRGGRRYSSSESAPTVKGPPDPRGRRVVCCASSHLLRLFPSAALLHPPLRLFFSYSGGSRGVAEGKGRSRRGRGRARGHRCARGRRPTRPFRIIGPARLAAGANGPAGGAARRLGKATGAHLPASAPRPSSSSHSSTNPDEKRLNIEARDISESFSPEPMAQGPGPARRCGKDGRGVDVARTGAAPTADPVHTGTPCGRGAHRSRTPRFAPDSSAPSRRS